MKNKYLILILSLVFILLTTAAQAQELSIAFYYGSNPPASKLKSYENIVVNPQADFNPKNFIWNNTTIFAYVSIGETNPAESYYKNVDKKWIVGRNNIWKSDVMNLADPAWQTFILEKIITPLWERGYKGFFLDTLDSYRLAKLSPQEQSKQIKGLIQIIKLIKERYPDAKLILNRGFEIIPSVQNDIFAIAVESLYVSWSEEKKQYMEVSEADRKNLLGLLQPIIQMKIPIVVIDYLPADDKAKIQNISDKIQKLGMTPWIANPSLTEIYTEDLPSIPRKVLVLYQMDRETTIFNADAFNNLALPLEYMGLIPVFHDITAPLPDHLKENGFLGIISYDLSLKEKDQLKYFKWLQQQRKYQIPIVFFGSFGVDEKKSYLKEFGLIANQNDTAKSVNFKITKINPRFIGYEIKPIPNIDNFFPITIKNGKILFQIQRGNDALEDVAAITEWGGYALPPFLVTLPNGASRWVINPLTFLKEALKVPDFPMPDVTTENGKRLMMVHIDGDGFSTKVESNPKIFASEELNEKILQRYRIPTTVSIITSEFTSTGLYPKIASKISGIANKIFLLPWVEIASHTYSHPFDWVLVKKAPRSGIYNLPVPNYIFKPEDEVGESANFINTNITKKSKYCRVLLWSGLANADNGTLELAYQAGLANLNGGDTNIIRTNPTITAIAPYGRQKGNYYQIYSPISNEEFYTNSWGGPFYGFQRVIETMEMTDSPERFKPIDIYYHFYSASKDASLNALIKVYEWALSQETMNVYISDYVAKILEFNSTQVSKQDDGSWLIRTHGKLREFRVPKSMGWPDLNRSNNLVGYSEHNNYYYLHLGIERKSHIYFTTVPNNLVYLKEANGWVTSFKRNSSGLNLGLQSYLPLKFTLSNSNKCQLRDIHGVIKPYKTISNESSYELKGILRDEITINCQ